ncbi:zinc finger protein 423 isoform X1 [Parasteatoda tepidariorum]|uniref:zinc finger protein 423 isoform X1 n=2 Tax=Parasteatoda tepidariorum TaxID=114398 RepID=UPI0039BC4185
MSRRKQAKPRALKREDVDGFPDESTEELGIDLMTENGEKENNTSLPMEMRNSTEESTLLESSLETTLLPADMENSRESELNGTPTSWRSSDTPDDQSLSPNSCTPLSDADAESISYTIGVTENTPYACQFCDKAFPRLNYLKRHEQVHSDQLPFMCDYCKRLFKHKRSRDRHVKLHTGDRKYRCNQCEAAFSRSDHLKIHMKTHDNAKPYQCTVCNRGYNTAAALTSHMQNHKKDLTNPSSPSSNYGGYRCLQCSASFPSAKELQTHVTIHETAQSNERKHNCNYCSDVFTSQEILVTHLEEKHASEFHTSCPECEETFNNYSEFLVHKEFHATGKRRRENSEFECTLCSGKEFVSSDALKQHIDEVHIKRSNSRDSTPAIHSTTSPQNNIGNSPDNRSFSSPTRNTFSCQYCTMKFESVFSLQTHTIVVHSSKEITENGRSNEPVCTLCNKLFHDDLSLTAHMKVMHDKELNLAKYHAEKEMSRSKNSSPRNPFMLEFPIFNNGSFGGFPNPGPLLCNQCNAALPDFESFRTHLKTHLECGTQKFSCFECDGQFPSEEVFNNHVANHYLAISTEYGCQSCPKMFSKPDQLQRHLMDTHAHQLYQCSLCKDMFQSKVDIQIHFSMKHSDQCRTFKCTSCNVAFQTQNEFSLHVKIAHFAKYPPFRCPICSLCFPSESLFQVHMQYHKKYSCLFCPEFFPVEFLLERHIQEKHSGENILPVTARERENVQNLSIKTNSKSDSDSNFESSPKKQLRCDMCDISFTVESSLIVHKRQVHHIRTSGSQKPGQTTLSLFCAYCNESCKSRTELENHMKSHTVSPSKHKCNICDEICPSAGTLAEHKLEHCKVVTNSTCVVCHTAIQQEDQFHAHTHQHNPQGLPAPCIICRQTLMSDVEVQVHAKHHLRSTEFLYNCCVCGRKGSIQQLIITGTQENHTYMCKNCFHAKGNDFRFAKSDDLRCQKCQVKFESILEYENHKLCHQNTFQCIKCQLSFDSLEEIQVHVATHVLEEGTDHVCHLCKRVFDSPAKLQCHLIEHTYEGCPSYDCYLCKAAFSSASLIQQHMLEHGMEAKPYICSLCHQKFFFKAEWSNHSFCHPNYPKEIANFSCQDCNLRFTSLKSYQSHCKIHESSGNFKCTLCPEAFAAPGDLQQHHFKYHADNEFTDGKKSFPCNDCDQVFPCKSNLQGHQRIHSQGAKFTCPTCNKAFSVSRNLTIHMRTHTGVKPYECPICKMRFARKENRKAHLKSHSGKKPYLCPHCGKGFSRSCHAKEHIRIHATSTTYPCELCSETFPSTLTLKNHLVSAHDKHFDHSCSVCSEVFEDVETLNQHMLKEHDVRTNVSSPLEEESESSLGQSSSSGDTKDMDSSEYSSNIEESDTRDSPLSIVVDNEEHSIPVAQTVT